MIRILCFLCDFRDDCEMLSVASCENVTNTTVKRFKVKRVLISENGFLGYNGSEAPLCESSHYVFCETKYAEAIGLRTMGICIIHYASVCKTFLGLDLSQMVRP